MNKSAEKAIEEILNFLSKSQDVDGNFGGPNVFHTSLILLCLKNIENYSVAKTIINNGLKFLFKERHQDWAWNYWRHDIKKFVPDDLDDTSTALAAISLYRPKKITGKVLGALTKLLIECEIEEGGPYSTWIVPKKMKNEWLDCDIVVNSNIAYLLSLHGVNLPKLSTLAEKAIKAGVIESRYYLNHIVIFYFISRFYKGELRELACQKILRRRNKNGFWKDPLETALAVSSLLNFDYPVTELENSRKYLIKISGKKNSYEPVALYIEEILVKPVYSGSKALTAAFILEALSKYQMAKNKEKNFAKNLIEKRACEKMHQKVLKGLGRSATEASQWEQFSLISKKILEKDPKRQITLLPYFFREALKGGGSQISDKIIIKLGQANLAGWIAYEIYDDFLDNQGEPLYLPLANFCLRQLTTIYCNLLPDSDFVIFSKIMSDLDAANLWERENAYFKTEKKNLREARLPNYGSYEVLANKSLGHALGPIIILKKLGFSNEGLEIKRLLKFFKHYIIARQLNDDAHDWLEDLGRGFINTAAVKILKIQRDGNEKEMQSIFWQKVILELAEEIYDHLKIAEKSIKKMSIFKNLDYFNSLLETIKTSTDKAVADRKKMLDFLKCYR